MVNSKIINASIAIENAMKELTAEEIIELIYYSSYLHTVYSLGVSDALKHKLKG